jgi:hypothetical protein
MMRKENDKRELNKKPSISFIALLVFISIALTSMNACGIGGGTQKWKEEVQLSDGRMIVVDMEMISESGGDEWVSNRSLSKPKEYRIRFSSPDGSGKVIEWRSTKISPATYPELPLILDMESGQPIIFSVVYVRDRCEVYNKYIYKNGVWIEEKLPEKFEKRITNLFLKRGTHMPRYVDLETKRKQNAYYGYRQSIKQVGPNREVCS